jgi:thioredoxin 1
MRVLLSSGLAILLCSLLVSSVPAAGMPGAPANTAACATCGQDDPIPITLRLHAVYPGLSRGPLSDARLEGLPKGLLLRSEHVDITEAQLLAEITRMSPAMQPIMHTHGFFVLEQMATRQLLAIEARTWAIAARRDVKNATEASVMQAYLATIAAGVKVTEADARAFYDANTAMLGGAKYDAVAKDVKAYLLEQKQQAAVDAHVNTISSRTVIEVNRDWLRGQAAAMLDNPVDHARRSGKPSVIDFGRDGCGPCDMMTPILEELRGTYANRCNVVFCHVGDQPILAARYNIQSIPVQVFFDKDGREIFRHVGFFSKAQMVEQIQKLGVQ